MAGMVLEWSALLLRWTHVVAAIAWIGSSFYFIAADLALRPRDGLDPKVKGETWQVHGGGFYHIQKYQLAPAFLPAELTWFKWEAYATWIFGFLLMLLVYDGQPRLYLIDPSVADLAPWQAVAISIGSLAVGWGLYDLLCRSPIGRHGGLLSLVGLGLLLAAGAAYLQLFGGRAAFLQEGALAGSLMAGNVFFVIIPNQKKTVAALKAGQAPDPRLGLMAKQRSLHNNYLTLPVVFLMLSNHYPFLFAAGTGLPVLAGMLLIGFLVRHYFNQKHAGQLPSRWLWPAAAALTVGLIALTLPRGAPEGGSATVAFAEVQPIIAQRCQVCHSERPQFPGISQAPKDVILDSADDILAHKREIEQQVVILRAMPLNNLTQLAESERATLAAWLAEGAPGP